MWTLDLVGFTVYSNVINVCLYLVTIINMGLKGEVWKIFLCRFFFYPSSCSLISLLFIGICIAFTFLYIWIYSENTIHTNWQHRQQPYLQLHSKKLLYIIFYNIKLHIILWYTYIFESLNLPLSWLLLNQIKKV